jgi:hypothetical protein
MARFGLIRPVTRWLARHGLALGTGFAAALPIIVSTVHGVAAGWLPLGDDAISAVRAYDVLSTHPPLVGPHSTSSLLIGQPVASPGPMLFWLLAIPVRLGTVAPAIAMGIVNTAAVIGIVMLARRRGGDALMLATAAGVAAACASLEAPIFHGLWGPSAAVLPFTLLIFLAWSLACGEHRLLPLTALVASFAVQAHLTYVLPGAAILAVALAFLAASRPGIGRRWLLATLAVVAVCWSLPLAEEVVHRPGNAERIVQAATADTPTLGASAGWHAVVRAVGVPPWWLEGPRAPFTRIADVTYAPLPGAIATAVMVLLGLAVLAAGAFRARRREVAAAALLALVLLGSLGVVTASTPTSHGLFAVVSYTLWWASPAGMFSWLVLAYGAVVLLPRGRLPARMRVPVRRHAALVAGVAAVVVIGAIAAAAGKHDRLENAFRPARAIVDSARHAAPSSGTVMIGGSASEVATDLQGGVALGLRRSGVPFVVSTLPGIGTRYDPARHPHDHVMAVIERPPAGQATAQVIARALLDDVPADAPPAERAARPVVLTLAPAAGRR